MKEFIEKISSPQHLTREEAKSMMREIMEGQATSAQIAAVLIALKCKGEHVDELLGFVEVMREKSVKVRLDDPDAIDMCGTGGDGSGTFNISTVSSFVVAGAGVTVAKHGNRSVSSTCGSADVLKALGVNIEIDAQKVETCINKVGIGFLYAPMFHPAMKHAAQTRADLGIKTCFNLLGPMTNPANVKRQLVGVFSYDAAKNIADVFSQLETEKVFVIHSHDGLDEISLQSPTTVFEVRKDIKPKQYEISATSFSLPAVAHSEILGGNAETNAAIAWKILRGEKIPHRHYVVANSAFGLLAAGNANSIQHGVQLAEESIDSGNALKKLNELIAFTNR